nr:MAG TPA: hypothetical protein [Caudoviricetes sp.]
MFVVHFFFFHSFSPPLHIFLPLDILYNDISCIILSFPFSSSYYFPQ